LGVLSDYPVRDKLNALGVAESFSLALCTTDPEINALKPHPRGFKRACELWHLHPEEILYVGDRVDVDEKGARAAGLQFAILGHRNERRPSDSVVVPHLRSLAEAFP
jgi:HAD superfamily hydrolase (TIGR01549 family)